MLEYKIHQNNNLKHIKDLYKRLAADMSNIIDAVETAQISTKKPAKKKRKTRLQK